MSATNRTGGVTGPRPPSILERHWGAPSLPPPASSFQPSPTANYPGHNNPAHFVSPQFNPGYSPYQSQPSTAGYGHDQQSFAANYPPSHGAGPTSAEFSSRYSIAWCSWPFLFPCACRYSNEMYEGSTNLHREHSVTSNGPPPFDSQLYNGMAPVLDRKPSLPSGMDVHGYQHQVAQMNFNSSGGPTTQTGVALGREPSGRLKNPYDDSMTADYRSGTPTHPNIQQSYFAHSHPDSFGSTPGASGRPVPPRELVGPTRDAEDRAQRTLSVINADNSLHSIGVPQALGPSTVFWWSGEGDQLPLVGLHVSNFKCETRKEEV